MAVEMELMDIVFNGPPGPDAPRFIEVEDRHGHSKSVGEWVDRGDGTWALRVMVVTNDGRAR